MCRMYRDDMIVIDFTFREHLHNLRKVFQLFREAHLKLNPEKFNSFRRKCGAWVILCLQEE